MSVKSFVLFLFAAAAFAQRPVPNPIVPPELRRFLELTDAQVQAITRANGQYLEYAADKSLRMAQVQREIFQETEREVLDQGALGIRYAEMEAIRRDLEDRQKRLREQIGALLTDPQKAKVKVLSDARALQPLITGAECANILAPLADARLIIPVLSTEPLPAFPNPGNFLRFGCLSFAGPPGPLSSEP